MSGSSDVLARCEALARASAVDAALSAPQAAQVPSQVLRSLVRGDKSRASSEESSASAAGEAAWEALPDVAKAALLWEHGFVLTGRPEATDGVAGDGVVQVFTACEGDAGAQMRDIGLSAEEFECEAANCGAFEQATNAQCSTEAVGQFKCAVVDAEAQVPASSGSAWTTASSSSAIPYPQLYLHALSTASSASASASTSTSGSTGDAFEVFAIHMRASDAGVECYNSGDLIIPCRRLASSSTANSTAVAAAASFCPPAVNTSRIAAFLATVSLVEAANASSSSSSQATTITTSTAEDSSPPTLAVILAVCGAVVFLIVFSLVVRRCRQRRRAHKDPGQGGDSGTQWQSRAVGARPTPAGQGAPDTNNQPRGRSWRQTWLGSIMGGGDRGRETTMMDPNTLDRRRSSARRGHGGGKSFDEYCSESETLAAFFADPNISANRLPYEDLTFLRLLSKGAFGEVWLGQLETRHVAIKKLLPERQHATAHLEQFAAEIQLMAGLEHANIISFVGVTWDRMQNLSAVVEYMDAGDLDAVIRKLGAKMTWRKEKMKVAMGVAEGLVYLHCLRPVVVHRDLKSKNVLLSRNWHVKLSDFGVSRQAQINETMTSGVGTLLWTAPEIIQGRKYSEKADVYSFGVVLSELDTCLPPFAHVTDPTGSGRGSERLPGMQIAQLVKQGKARVGFRDDCPPSLKTLALECTDLDPDRRPSAMQIAFTLKSIIAPSLRQGAESEEVGSSSTRSSSRSATAASSSTRSSNGGVIAV